jgi:superfamily II DNA or RNA helicase
MLVEMENNSIIIASYGTFSTGVNIKNLHNIIFASPSKSRIRNLQSIGRGLRLGENKNGCVLFDIADDMTHSSRKNYSLQHFIERVKIYNDERFEYKMYPVKLT